MSRLAAAFFSGLAFALGLGLSGMTDPRKVIGFLDVFGAWDPSLMFVMLGAIPVYALASRIASVRPRPVLDPAWHVPQNRRLSRGLVIGSLIFGAGWGLAGYCPGPAVVSLMKFSGQPLAFVLAMLLGFFAARRMRWE